MMSLRILILIIVSFATVGLMATEIVHVGLVDETLLHVEIVDGDPKQGIDGKFGTVENVGFNASSAMAASSYTLLSKDHADYSAAQHPKTVYRKSVGKEFVQTGGWAWQWSLSHNIYLRLPKKLKAGASYSLSTGSAFGKALTITFTMDDKSLRSMGIHLSEIGFIPRSPKRGFLSHWAGTGGGINYSALSGKDFIVYTSKGKEAARGKIALRRKAKDKGDDAYGSNFQSADVYEMDFSSLEKEGDYVLCVPSIGCSEEFVINKSSYARAYKIALKGLYYQRCGCEQPAKYAGETWKRARCHHPKDGKEVIVSNFPLSDADMGFGKLSAFKELPKQATKEKLPDYWGGWHDAGDYDRRIQHVRNAAQLLDVYAIFPKHFKDGDVNIPESGNGVPDIIDEALWCIDFFIRGMTDEGGVRGGIESEDHPGFQDSSWNDKLHLYAYKEDALSSYTLAWGAAKAARMLILAGKKKQSKKYKDAAEKAYAWAKKQDQTKLRDYQNKAAAELYALTGDDVYQQDFKKTCVFIKDPNAPTTVHNKHDQRAGALTYALTQSVKGIDTQLQGVLRKAVLRAGDGGIHEANKRTFYYAGNLYRPLNWGLGASPDVMHLIDAYALSKDKKYADAVMSSASFTLGGNPCNLVFMSGLGKRRVTQMLALDSWRQIEGTDVHDCVPGLVPSGPIKFKSHSKGLHGFTQKSFFPDIKNWPPLESYAGNRFDPGQNEHTPNSMGPAIQAYAFIDAFGSL